jgi:hypothetical protein
MKNKKNTLLKAYTLNLRKIYKKKHITKNYFSKKQPGAKEKKHQIGNLVF